MWVFWKINFWKESKMKRLSGLCEKCICSTCRKAYEQVNLGDLCFYWCETTCRGIFPEKKDNERNQKCYDDMQQNVNN